MRQPHAFTIGAEGPGKLVLFLTFQQPFAVNHQEKVKATFCSGSNQEKHIEKGHIQLRGMGHCWWDIGGRDQLYSGDWRGPGKGQEEKQV